ncbi:hypothetical protein U9M48_018050 [Paspalum notatum var. saurae]|uniref:Uncharacterized protein n=1 Tax=Paspalum notatum var. saurae TaxID=547442 RepID=A0AAQ3TCD1_PASNO
MALSLRRRLPLLHLLLAIFAAASRGDDQSGEAYNTTICERQPYRCGEVNISYPFYLSDQTADIRGQNGSYCGYPGLGINCVGSKYPTLELDDYSYNVTHINYTDNTISLADPDVLDDESCPQVDHNVTVPSNMWLMNSTEHTVGFLFFFANCSTPTPIPVPGLSINITPIPCASPDGGGGGYSFAVPSYVPHQNLLQQCKDVFQVPVLQNASKIDQDWSTSGYRNILDLGFQLEVNSSQKSEQCNKCEESNGQCAYNRSGEFVGCLCDNGQVEDQECTNGSGNTLSDFY